MLWRHQVFVLKKNAEIFLSGSRKVEKPPNCVFPNMSCLF